MDSKVKEKEVNPFTGSSLQWDHMAALEAIRLLASRLSCHRPLKTDEKEFLDKLGVKI